MYNFSKPLITVAVATLMLAGCSDSDNNNKQSPAETNNNLDDNANYVNMSVDGSGPKYLELNSGHVVSAGDGWDISYQKYIGFAVNGGVSGSGGVQSCVAHQYPELFNAEGELLEDEHLKLSKQKVLDDFNAVTAKSCDDFQEDGVKAFITMEDWLDASYGPSGPSFSAKTGDSNGWIIRSATKNNQGKPDAYARVKVAEVIYGGGKKAIKFARETWNAGSQSFDASETMTGELDFSQGRVYWDMQANSPVTASDDWELSVAANGRSWDIQVNQGVSGQGDAGVGLVIIPNGNAFSVTNPTDTSQVFRWFSDSVTGGLAGPGNFGPLHYGEYQNNAHALTPTFTTYLIKHGEKTYKMQVLNNYGEDGKQASGNLYLRYQLLTQ